MKKLVNAILVSWFLPLIVTAQFTINVEFRPRAEIRNGYKQLPDSGAIPAYLITQRSRLGVIYRQEWLKSCISFQDARVWGDENNYSSTGIYGDTASVELNEAWVELTFLTNSSIRIGRQYFEYDDARLLSTRNWGQTGISYDAVLYKFTKDNWSVDAALSLNNKADNTFGNAYPSSKMKTLNFVRLAKRIDDNLSVSGIALASGYTAGSKSETIYLRGSYGVNIICSKKPVGFKTSFYFQNGKNKSGVKVGAWNFNAAGEYAFGKTNLNAGITILSGDKTGDAGEKDQLFDLLYGVRHRFYGLMDNFSNLPKATANGGLIDVFAGISHMVTQKTKISADYHYFALQQSQVRIANQNIKLDGMLGSEIDLSFRTNFSKVVYLEGGYSVMLPTSAYEKIQGTDKGKSEFSCWGWLMLTVKPEIFSSK